MTQQPAARPSRSWTDLPSHRLWLGQQAESLFAFFERESINPNGGFHALDDRGKPMASVNGGQIHVTTRMIYSFSLAQLLGRPGADALIDHGIDFLLNRHRDAQNGGYFWGTGTEPPMGGSKQAYAHAFVLLAAASAKTTGHPMADRLLDEITDVIDNRFWDDTVGACREEFTHDWQELSTYRGANSNMHMAECLMAAHEATGEGAYLAKAERIADFFVNGHARSAGWRLPEHFDANWVRDDAYIGNPMFRPIGTTPGHSLEWSRLLLQMWHLGGKRHAWMPDAARNLFLQAMADGWDIKSGGFYYTIGADGSPLVADRYWWPCCEAIAAAACLRATFQEPVFEHWYRRCWSFTATHLLDRENGGWIAQLDADLHQNSGPFFGKPDIYHAIQACLIPLHAPHHGLLRHLENAALLPTPSR